MKKGLRLPPDFDVGCSMNKAVVIKGGPYQAESGISGFN